MKGIRAKLNWVNFNSTQRRVEGLEEWNERRLLKEGYLEKNIYVNSPHIFIVRINVTRNKINTKSVIFKNRAWKNFTFFIFFNYMLIICRELFPNIL